MSRGGWKANMNDTWQSSKRRHTKQWYQSRASVFDVLANDPDLKRERKRYSNLSDYYKAMAGKALDSKSRSKKIYTVDYLKNRILARMNKRAYKYRQKHPKKSKYHINLNPINMRELMRTG